MIKKRNHVTDYWNKRGETYSRSWQSVAKKRLSSLETGLFKNAYKSIITTSNKNPVKVLDIGIAIGRISDVILKYDVSLYCTDISETMIRLC